MSIFYYYYYLFIVVVIVIVLDYRVFEINYRCNIVKQVMGPPIVFRWSKKVYNCIYCDKMSEYTVIFMILLFVDNLKYS